MIKFYELVGKNPQLRFSPYCWRIRMALAHKGVEAKSIPWHFGEVVKLPGGKNLQKVPVLIDGGEVIADSTEIARHLEQKYSSGPALFESETEIGSIRFVIAWTDLVLQPALFPNISADILAVLPEDSVAYFRETREARLGMTLEKAAANREKTVSGIHKILMPLQEVLNHTPFLGGEEPNYADYTVFGAFQWLRSVSNFEVLAPATPMFDWRENMLDLFDGLAREALTYENA